MKHWKTFEEIVAEVFQLHGYETDLNFRFKTSRRYEIDVLAVCKDKAIAVDCKRWLGGRYKLSQLKKEAEKHAERSKELANVWKDEVKEVIPIIVTLKEEGIKEWNGVIILPIWKLNTFLLEELL